MKPSYIVLKGSSVIHWPVRNQQMTTHRPAKFILSVSFNAFGCEFREM